MKITTIESLKIITDFYVDLYGKCNEFLRSCNYFENPNNSYSKNILDRWIFFRAVKYSFEFTLIIELCKLFQNKGETDPKTTKNYTQKYNINKFVNILINSHKSLKYKDKLTKELIKKWSDRLNSEETKNSIKYIETIRDKLFAHTDNLDGYFQHPVRINLSKIEYLLNVIKDILMDIYSFVYDSDLVINEVSFVDLKGIIEIILESKENIKKFNPLADKD
jgi:hypothetical protein